MIRSVMLAVVLHAGALVSFAGQASGPLTLEQAVERTLTAHPLLRAADLQILAATARVEQTRAERRPTVTVSETATHSNNPVFAFGSLLEQGRFGADNFTLPALNNPAAIQNFRAAVSSSVSLYNGGKTAARTDQATSAVEGARENRGAIEQQLRYQALRAYHRLILARDALAVAEQATRSAEADTELARNRRDAGLSVDADFLAAEVQLADFRRRRIDAESETVLAQSEMNVLMGRPSAETIVLPAAEGFREFEAAPEEDLVRAALQNRPDYLASKAALRSAEQAVREQSGGRLPRVDAFANAGLSGRNPVTGSTDYALGASVSFDVFDSGRKARIAEAQYQEAAALARLEETTRQIRLEVLRARQQWLTARAQLNVSRASATQAAEALRITQDRYQAGLESVTALLRAQTDLLRAQTNVIASENAYTVDYAALLMAAGNLENVNPFTATEVRP